MTDRDVVHIVGSAVSRWGLACEREDVAMEVVRRWRAHGCPQRSGWVWRCVRSVSVDWLRKHSRVVTVSDLEVGFAEDRGYLGVELALDLRSALSRLPWLERSAVVCAALGMDSSESSVRLGVTVRRYRAALRRGRRRLEALMDGWL